MGLSRCLSPMGSKGLCLNGVNALFFSCFPREERDLPAQQPELQHLLCCCSVPELCRQSFLPTYVTDPPQEHLDTSLRPLTGSNQSVPRLGRIHLFTYSKPSSHLLWCTQKPSQEEIQVPAGVISSNEGELMHSCGKAPAGQQLHSNLAPMGKTSLALVWSLPCPNAVTVLLVIKSPFSDTSFHLEPLQP